MKKSKKTATFTSLLPQEEMLEVKKHFKSLYIGIPKEISYQENRVSLSPDAVALLVSNGHKIVIEKGAGVNANFSDEDYSHSGATIVYNIKDVYKATVILKIEPPTTSEIKMMQKGQTLISALQLTTIDEKYINLLLKSEITALAYEYIKDENGILSLIRSISEIAGNTSILIAAEYLSNVNSGKGLMLGGVTGISPTEVVVLGAGTVGEFATRTALGLGASVRVFDSSITKLRRVQEIISRRVSTSILQPKALQKALMRSDVVIGALRADDGRTPCVVSEEMVKKMKSGAVIVDVSIDQGGCFESSEVTNHKKPTYRKFDVVHYCVPNISSRVSRTASFAISNILAPTLLQMGMAGGVDDFLKQNAGLRSGVYAHKGMLTSAVLGSMFDMPYKNLNLIM
ncbi:MAG TPA: alanine dehydrogenase [Flavobacteriales bacterium]|jgi:alanine dehydrogenase|nr:alanine dehydrogenase [Flavobacteriales bacterium]HJN64154.1 alanine dehydrogenase [Flavobacteriales bacterium]|tara:strand:+ start:9657 stop:10856 length:1200 start_codon:yes stop_codon:yes gene_type:complete